MRHGPRKVSRAIVSAISLLTICAHSARGASHDDAPNDALTNDSVIARVYEHLGDHPRPLVLVVDSTRFPPAVWRRVKHLVAFRLHRPQPDGATTVDAAIYLVRDSPLYARAAEVLRDRATNHDYVWCLLSAVLAHEGAHTEPMTERRAVMAELAQLRRCLLAGHLSSGDGWSPLWHLQKVQARLRNPREHY